MIGVDKQRKRIAFTGACWLVTGIIAVLVGVHLNTITICPCTMILTSAPQPYAYCNCPGRGTGWEYIGAVAVVIGVAIIASRRKISEMMKRLEHR